MDEDHGGPAVELGEKLLVGGIAEVSSFDVAEEGHAVVTQVIQSVLQLGQGPIDVRKGKESKGTEAAGMVRYHLRLELVAESGQVPGQRHVPEPDPRGRQGRDGRCDLHPIQLSNCCLRRPLRELAPCGACDPPPVQGGNVGFRDDVVMNVDPVVLGRHGASSFRRFDKARTVPPPQILLFHTLEKSALRGFVAIRDGCCGI